MFVQDLETSDKSQPARILKRMPLEEELQKIYDSEINVEISWLWDGGIAVKLGDPLNGYLARAEVRAIAEIIPWLQRAIARHYPESGYIKALGPDVPARPGAQAHRSDPQPALPELWRGQHFS